MHDFAFVLTGFAVGLIVGLTGVGGGSIMTPLLIGVFGIKPHLAIGTDSLVAAYSVQLFEQDFHHAFPSP